jgi:hypothetical protein
MSKHILVEIEVPEVLDQFKHPPAVDKRLHKLLDRQDRRETLTTNEKDEAQGLVDLAELLSLLRLRTQRIWSKSRPRE